MGDDRFRFPGSTYEHEEPVAFAEVGAATAVDWSSPASAPANTLWLPESLFAALCRRTTLGSLDIYRQSRLCSAECQSLAQELTDLETVSLEPDILLAAALLREKVESVAAGGGATVLLVEGP